MASEKISRNSSVDTATVYGLDGVGLIAGSQPIHWILEAIYPGVKRQGREADRSHTSTADVKNGVAIPQLSPMSSWRSAYFIKHRSSFTFLGKTSRLIFGSLRIKGKKLIMRNSVC
jgi:hypothetical protein